MQKLKYIRVKQQNGQYTADIPIATDAQHVDMTNGNNLQDTIGNINVTTDGSITQNLNSLRNDYNQLDQDTFKKQDVTTEIPDAVNSWLNTNISATTPLVDASLSISDAAADAKVVGDELSDLKSDLGAQVADLNEITKIGKQLFDKANADIVHLIPSNGIASASANGTSIIVPVSPSANDSYITVHKDVITSRFIVATFAEYPESGVSYITQVNNTSAPYITINVDTSVKYIMVYCHLATEDTSVTVEEVADGLMVEFGASYTGYEPYSLRVIIPTKSVDGNSFSDDGIGLITDIVDAKTEDVQTLADANKHQVVGKTDVTLTWTEGSYYNFTTGEITALSGRAYSAKVDCKAGDRISVTNNKGQILYWKADGSFVSYLPTDYPSTMTYVVPADVTKFALNNSDSTIRASIVTVRTDGSELITKTYDAPAKLIFDSDAFEQGKYCSTSNGKISNLSSYWCLPFVSVKPNHKYRTEDQTQVVFYSATGEFLSALLPNGSASWTGVDTEMDFTTPSNCAFISVNAQNSHEKLFDMEPYTVVGDIINPQKLHGKTVVCFGDSITGNYGFGDNYPYQIERHTGAKTYNCGFGGCRMELIDTDAQHTNPFSMCGIVDALEAAKNGDSTAWDEQDEYAVSISKMVYLRLQILKAIDWSKVDVVTIAYGTNEGGYPQDDEENPTNKYTYGGATRYAVNKLLTLYPHLRIVLLTPIYRFYTSEGVDSDTHTHPTYGGKLTDNVETLIKVGGELKVPVLDLYHTLGINITNYTSYFGDEDEQYDGTHINSFGREQMGRRVAGELNRLF